MSPTTDRDALVAEAFRTIRHGSGSFAAASTLFARETRERAWLLYAWCRAADDMTDGQELGQGQRAVADASPVQAELETLTRLALDTDLPVPLPFAALRQVSREVRLPRRAVADHLAGFALDAQGWRPRTEDDLLRYCYHVAGAVGCLMAAIMGIDADDHDTLDRACDLGIAFQLANIARDIVPDARAGRVYLPQDWLDAAGIAAGDVAAEANRAACAGLAGRLIAIAETHRRSARIGAGRLPVRSRWAVLAADRIYGAIGEAVAARGVAAWDQRTRVSDARKLWFIAAAGIAAIVRKPQVPRDPGLWTRPR
jgi:phytoene synthase